MSKMVNAPAVSFFSGLRSSCRGHGVSESHRVRDYVYRHYIDPARAINAASITVIADDVHKA